MKEKILIEAKFEYIKRLVIAECVIGLLGIITSILIPGLLSLVGIPAGIFCLYQSYKYQNAKNQKLVITDSCIYGKTPREEFNLPINKITTVNILKNKELRIILPSKKLKFYSCLNSKEVYDIIIDLIKNEPFEEKNSYNSNTKAIKEYKELLDIGAITQEEFEAKKKELLNL